MIEQILQYNPSDEEILAHRQAVELMRRFGQAAFSRALFMPGHITASAVVESHDRTSILMNYHKAANRWICCLGGHGQNGETDPFKIAEREAAEEAGFKAIKPVSGEIFYIDGYQVAGSVKRAEPDHVHLDFCYLFRAEAGSVPRLSNESFALEWCGYDEAVSRVPSDGGIRRMLDKWYKLALTS